MALHRGIDGSDPLRGEPARELPGAREIRKAEAAQVMAMATFACPACDAPVAPGAEPLGPADGVSCPYCAHAGAVRDFLSLDDPARPAVVEVRVVST